MYHTSLSGADCIDPTNKLIRADGNERMSEMAAHSGSFARFKLNHRHISNTKGLDFSVPNMKA